MSLAVIAGSGLGELARAIDVERETAFADIPGVGAAMIAGHAGRIMQGTLNGRPCQLVLGRRHFYEGDPHPIDRLIDHVAAQGATTLLVTSAVGSLRRELRTGELVVIRDIVDHQNRELTRALAGGGQRGRPGGRATECGGANGAPERGCWPTGPASARGLHTDREATLRFEAAATEARVPWQPGTMFCASGPPYETLGEVEFQQYADADVAAMSGAPEVTRANQLGLPVVSVTVVTNPCTGINCSVPSHQEVLEAGARASRNLARAVSQFIVKL